MAVIFSIIVSTRLRNDFYVFKIDSTDILFYSSPIAVLNQYLDGKIHLFCFLKNPI